MAEEQRREAAHAALCDLIQQIDPGAMVTRWVALIEIVDSDSERVMWSLCAPDQRAWESLGMLDFARALEYAALAQPD